MPETDIVVNQDRLVNFFLELARQNTPPKHETAAMKVAEKWLDELGFEYFYDDAHIPLGAETGNLIAFKKGTVNGAPTIFFSSHFDTVEATPGWNRSSRATKSTAMEIPLLEQTTKPDWHRYSRRCMS